MLPKVYKQDGIILLILSIVLILGVLTYLVTDFSINQSKQNTVHYTQLQLNKAKQALLSYAVARSEIIGGGVSSRKGKWGYLPCPDISGGSGEGNEAGNCGDRDVSQIGWLPYRSLKLDVIEDGNGDCLLYAVSGNYKLSPDTSMLNEDSNGFFEIVDNNDNVIVGAEAENRIVAIVFSPGKVLAGDARQFLAGSECGSDYNNIESYLDSNGATNNADVSTIKNTIDKFLAKSDFSALETDSYNDQFITITRQEVWDAVNARSDFTTLMTEMTEALAICLANYANTAPVSANSALPWPSEFALADYSVDENYTDTVDLYAGRYPFAVNESNNRTGHVFIGDELFKTAGCEAIVVTGGNSFNLRDDFIQGRQLWQQWKDHFFYAVAKGADPKTTTAGCAGSCLSVNGVDYSGVVIYSGSRQAGVTRDAPPLDVADDKADVSNYIENGNDVFMKAADGLDNYNVNGTNDIMFCLSATTPLSVTQC